LLIDLHTHSTLTPGARLGLPELVAAVRAAGLDGFCLTDLHTVAGGPEARRLAAEAGLKALVGFEARTDRGRFLVFVPEPERLPALDTWLRFDEQGLMSYGSLLGAVRERHGALVAIRPYDREVPGAPRDGLGGLEGLAAVVVRSGLETDLADDMAEELTAGLGLTGAAGSGDQAVGQAATLVCGELNSEADLVAQLRALNVWPVSLGDLPEIPRDRPPRDGDRPHRDGDRPHRDGDRPRRDGDRPRRDGNRESRGRRRQPGESGPPREGDRPQPSEGAPRRRRRRKPGDKPSGPARE
jgi:hypothetical protein